MGRIRGGRRGRPARLSALVPVLVAAGTLVVVSPAWSSDERSTSTATTGRFTSAAAPAAPGEAPWWSSRETFSTSVASRSSARATVEHRSTSDTQMGTRWVLASDLRVTGSANGTATCSRCTGTAVTVQVVYAYGTRHLTVRNDARARSSCVTCGSSALSIQVVVTDAPQRLAVSNSAAAVSTWCLGCTSVAAAVQVVLADPRRRQLDADGRARVAQVGAQMAALLARTASDSAAARWRLTPAAVEVSLTAGGRRLATLVQDELGGTVAAHGLAVRSA